MLADLHTTRERLRSGLTSAPAEIERAIAIAQSPACEHVFLRTRFDAVLSPTVPIVAAPIASVAPGQERDAEFMRVNALLLRNTSVVNMLDGCAISIPCQTPDELPVGLMLWHGAMRDDTILNIALQAEAALATAQPSR